jgi:hypothetical protein
VRKKLKTQAGTIVFAKKILTKSKALNNDAWALNPELKGIWGHLFIEPVGCLWWGEENILFIATKVDVFGLTFPRGRIYKNQFFFFLSS